MRRVASINKPLRRHALLPDDTCQLTKVQRSTQSIDLQGWIRSTEDTHHHRPRSAPYPCVTNATTHVLSSFPLALLCCPQNPQDRSRPFLTRRDAYNTRPFLQSADGIVGSLPVQQAVSCIYLLSFFFSQKKWRWRWRVVASNIETYIRRFAAAECVGVRPVSVDVIPM